MGLHMKCVNRAIESNLQALNKGISQSYLNLPNISEIKFHVYSKRQTSDSSWEFLRIENKQIKTVQNNSYV